MPEESFLTSSGIFFITDIINPEDKRPLIHKSLLKRQLPLKYKRFSILLYFFLSTFAKVS